MTERVTAAPPTLSESKLDEEFDQLGPRSRSGDTRALEAALDQGFTKSELIKRYLTVEKSPFTSGPYADLYLGRWEPPYDPKGIDVMVKVIRMGRIEDGEHFVAENKKCGENLERTVAVWQKMDCPRITPCIGYIEGFQNDVIPATVSLRRRNNLIDYTTYTNPQADRLNLLSQVVEGLAYLHKFEPDPIFHLDLKPDNILVTEEGSAELCDVGYTKALEDVSTGFSTGPNPGGAYPYLSPEVLMGDSFDQMTAGADIYAIGSIILYLLSGKRPWYRLKGKGLLIITITRGIWPKPVDHPMEGSEEAVQKTWDLVKRCLNMSAEERPPAQEVLAELLGIEAMGGVGPPID
ncbi:hypothetical protein FS837_011019 [Tulasnella sp. UAMH 9824]|nr:hypothetical protein FS837_011019 [Tulasnella sp. UAMH 9824]